MTYSVFLCRYDFLADFYMDCLEQNGAEFTISFPVRDKRNQVIYYLIFATSGENSYKCFKELKEALNRASTETNGLKYFLVTKSGEWLTSLI